MFYPHPKNVTNSIIVANVNFGRSQNFTVLIWNTFLGHPVDLILKTFLLYIISISFNSTLVLWIHVDIALNVVKALNLVQMKLSSCGSRIDLGDFQESSPIVCIVIWLFQTEV